MQRALLFAIGLFCVVAATCAQDTQSKGTISGYMFGDYFYNIARDSSFAGAKPPSKTALSGPKDMQGFQFRRIYFTYDDDISSQFTSRFRLEADQSVLVNNKIETYVKDAYLKWKGVFEGSDIIFGIQPTTAFDISETWWAYRPLEKTIMDLRGIIPSRDFGVALRGKVTGDGMLNYWAMIANGDGNSPVGSKFRRYSLNLQVKADQFQATLNGDYRAQAPINDPTSTSTPAATFSNDIFTGSVFAGYKEPNSYSFGVEAFWQSMFHSIVDSSSAARPRPLTGRNAIGFSVFGSVNLQNDLLIVGRYDYFDPDNNSYFKGDSRNYIIAGLDWKANKNVSIMPNVQIETYESVPLANGTTLSFDSSVTGRVTIYYVFI
ncbi:MAG TPA: hypothetical protein VLY03_01005 [Bacteroidota bacterium]|nr:hypothetical protein [Bacteroidota bacterium]